MFHFKVKHIVYTVYTLYSVLTVTYCNKNYCTIIVHRALAMARQIRHTVRCFNVHLPEEAIEQNRGSKVFVKNLESYLFKSKDQIVSSKLDIFIEGEDL